MNLTILLQYLYHAQAKGIDITSATKKLKETHSKKTQQEQTTSSESKHDEVIEEPVSFPQEILERIFALVNKPDQTKQEKAELTDLLLAHEDCAVEVYKQLSLPQRLPIALSLFQHHQGNAIATYEILSFITSLQLEDATQLQAWFLQESEEYPGTFPVPTHMPELPQEAYQLYASMALIHPFPQRLFLYGTKIQVVSFMREPVKEMIRTQGVEAAQAFLTTICTQYPIDIQTQILSLITLMLAPYKLKKETQLYQSLLLQYAKDEPEQFKDAYQTLDKQKQTKLNKQIELQAFIS